jgi:hypothetical protein
VPSIDGKGAVDVYLLYSPEGGKKEISVTLKLQRKSPSPAKNVFAPPHFTSISKSGDDARKAPLCA